MKKRFDSSEWTVTDRKTGLVWARNAGLSEFPLTWKEAFSFVDDMNRNRYAGYSNWRLPNRRESFSLISHSRVNPSLPEDHTFANVFHGYYWTANTCARLPGQAWYVHFGGAKMYRGMKDASNMVWPVRERISAPANIAFTGQIRCYDEKGQAVPCEKHSLQHMALAAGIQWPEPRFHVQDATVLDRLTGLTWTREARCGHHLLVTWQDAHEKIFLMNRENMHGFSDWRIPAIRELESLTDLGRHSPALPKGHPFSNVSDFYWSATTSMLEMRYAWAFYMKDGAVGVGFKKNPEFSLWPVRREKENGSGNLF